MSGETQEVVAEKPEVQEEAQATEKKENGQEVTYADESAKRLDEFLADTVGPDYADKVTENKEQLKKEQEKSEEEEAQKEEISPEDQKKIDDLLAKSEEEGLTDEEIAFMKEQGYEIEEGEEPVETKEEEPKKEEEEEASTFELPEDFISDIDDFFSDDENYDPDKVTTEERISYAHKAIRRMRENQTALQQAFADSPELAAFVSDVVVKNIDPGISAKKHFGDILDEEAPKPGTPEYDKWVIQREDAKREKKRIIDLQKKQEENLRKSAVGMNKFVEENKWNEKQRKEFNSEVDKAMQDIAKGIVSEDFLNMVKKGLNYDKDVQAAEQMGKVKAANQKIKFKKRQGDGLPKPKTTKKEPEKTVKYADEDAEGFDNFLNS